MTLMTEEEVKQLPWLSAKEVKENPKIRVLIKTKGVLYISVRNTVKDSEMEKPFRHNYTTKEDALLHGFGISCIRELVDKNGGRFDLNVSEGWFRAEIFFWQAVKRKIWHKSGKSWHSAIQMKKLRLQ